MSCPMETCGVDSKSINDKKICLRNYATGAISTDTRFTEALPVNRVLSSLVRSYMHTNPFLILI